GAEHAGVLSPGSGGAILSAGLPASVQPAAPRGIELMALNRRGFAKSLGGVVGAVLAGASARASAQAPAAAGGARAAGRLAPAKVTRIRLFYPPNYDRNGPQAFPQSNMVVLVDTDAGITGVGQGGSPDTVRNVARS